MAAASLWRRSPTELWQRDSCVSDHPPPLPNICLTSSSRWAVGVTLTFFLKKHLQSWFLHKNNKVVPCLQPCFLACRPFAPRFAVSGRFLRSDRCTALFLLAANSRGQHLSAGENSPTSVASGDRKSGSSVHKSSGFKGTAEASGSWTVYELRYGRNKHGGRLLRLHWKPFKTHSFTESVKH